MAKNKRRYDPKSLKGAAIYQEEKRTVYSPFYTKKGYVITESTYKAYTQYVQGYLIALLIFSVAYIITKDMWISVGLGGAFFIGTIVSFYLNFIKKAVLIENYVKSKKDNFFVRQAKSLPFTNLIVMTVCSFLLSGMIMLNGYINSFTGTYFTLNTALAIVALIYAFMNVYIIIYKKANNIKEDEE